MKQQTLLSLTGNLMMGLGLIGYFNGSDGLALFGIAAALPFYLPAMVKQMRSGRPQNQERRQSQRQRLGYAA